MHSETKITEHLTCYHCGEDCADDDIHIQDKHFCCTGCKTVYEILNQNNLCEYYDITKNPGIAQKTKIREGKFAFLDDKSVEAKLVHFSDEKQKHIVFYLPQMHCSSCIWLLEHLNKLEPGIVKSQVNFLKKLYQGAEIRSGESVYEAKDEIDGPATFFAVNHTEITLGEYKKLDVNGIKEESKKGDSNGKR